MYYPPNSILPVLLQPIGLDPNQINNSNNNNNNGQQIDNNKFKNTDENLNLSQLRLSTSPKQISYSQGNKKPMSNKSSKLEDNDEEESVSSVTNSDDESNVEAHQLRDIQPTKVYLSGFHPYYDPEMDVFALQCCTCCIGRCNCCRACDNFVSCPIYCWVVNLNTYFY